MTLSPCLSLPSVLQLHGPQLPGDFIKGGSTSRTSSPESPALNRSATMASHTKYALLPSATMTPPSAMGTVLTGSSAQVRGGSLDQHQEGDQPGRDGTEAQTCAKLHRIHMGPQVRPCLLGSPESVRLYPYCISSPRVPAARGAFHWRHEDRYEKGCHMAEHGSGGLRLPVIPQVNHFSQRISSSGRIRQARAKFSSLSYLDRWGGF